MEISEERLEPTVPAPFHMNLFDNSGTPAWKSLLWSVMDSMHQECDLRIELRRILQNGGS
jgi:hypothetical protein